MFGLNVYSVPAASGVRQGGEDRLRVLCIDHEGGHGGSSRSLLSVLRHIGSSAVVEVWCRRNSPLIEKYGDIGIEVRVIPELPIWRVDPTLRGTLSNARQQLPKVWRNRRNTAMLADEIGHRFDVVHLNYVSLQPLLYWLRRGTKCGVVMHMRHWPYRTRAIAWEMRRLSRIVDHFVFITENERAVFEALGGRGESTVILNVAPNVNSDVQPHPSIPSDGAFNFATVSNYAHARGTDRLVEVAQEMRHRGRKDIRFVVAGDNRFHVTDPGEFGAMGRKGMGLPDYAQRYGVADMFLFLGHVPNPEQVLAGCDGLIRLSRRSDTWGRDVIEAMAHAKPVIAVGQWDGFVENGKTGVRMETFDANLVATKICELADNRSQSQILGEQARTRIAQLCDGPGRAKQLLEVWQRVAARSLIDPGAGLHANP